MQKIISAFVLIALLYSCKNNALVTEKEVNAVQYVVDFYGGICYRHKVWCNICHAKEVPKIILITRLSSWFDDVEIMTFQSEKLINETNYKVMSRN